MTCLFMWYLSLIENERNGIEIGVGDVEDYILRDKCCLLGKVIADKPFNIDAFRTTMLKIWKVSRTISISVVGANMFVIEFQSLNALLKVKRGCLWMFDRNLVILKDFDRYTPI